MQAFLLYVSLHFFSLFLFFVAFVLALWLIFVHHKSHWLIYALIIWFPLEVTILKWLPIDYYPIGKYFPEILMYSALAFSWWGYIKSKGRLLPKLPVNRWLAFFLLVAFISLCLNWYSPVVWFLGVRQTLRFVVVFFIILFEEYPAEILKRFLLLGAGMIGLEALLGLVQYLMHGALDQYLFFPDTVSFGSVQLQGITEFWAPGQRVFATLGRYDRLGSLLAVGLVLAFPWLYHIKDEFHKMWAWLAFGIGLLALVLTYSRASWLACLVGIVVVGFFVLKDTRVLEVAAIGSGLAILYILFVIVFQHYGGGAFDKPSETLTQRAVEAVSWYSWQSDYEGYGRFFFWVNTPLVVVRSAPLFGVGPGNYGGGVAAALLNTKVYDILHLPFGIQNTYGQIDSNWLSLWGETGTLGLVAWIFLLVELIVSSRLVAARSKNITERTVAEGMAGGVASIMILALFGPYFEFRTLMVYFWLAAGIMMHYYREHEHTGNFLKK